MTYIKIIHHYFKFYILIVAASFATAQFSPNNPFVIPFMVIGKTESGIMQAIINP